MFSSPPRVLTEFTRSSPAQLHIAWKLTMRSGRFTCPRPSSPWRRNGMVRPGTGGMSPWTFSYLAQNRDSIASTLSRLSMQLPPSKNFPPNSSFSRQVFIQLDKWSTGHGLLVTAFWRDTFILTGMMTEVIRTSKVFPFLWMYLCRFRLTFEDVASRRAIEESSTIFGSMTPKLVGMYSCAIDLHTKSHKRYDHIAINLAKTPCFSKSRWVFSIWPIRSLAEALGIES